MKKKHRFDSDMMNRLASAPLYEVNREVGVSCDSETFEPEPVVGGTFTVTFPVTSQYVLNGKTVYRNVRRTTKPIPYGADNEAIKKAMEEASRIKTRYGGLPDFELR